MEFPIYLPAAAKDIKDFLDFMVFLNRLAYRWFQGHFRYGDPNRRQKYFSRLETEVDIYKIGDLSKGIKPGNLEQLLNIAVYCYLESKAPENPNFHFDSTVDSATRKEFGI